MTILRVDSRFGEYLEDQLSQVSLQGGIHLSEAGRREFGQKLFDYLERVGLLPSQVPQAVGPWLGENIGELGTEAAQLSVAVYMMVKERMCFQNLGYVANVKKLLELACSLKEQGIHFFHTDGAYPTHMTLLEVDERISWKVLSLICRLEFLTRKKKVLSSSPEIRELLFACFSVQQEASSQIKEISTILDCIRYMELQENSSEVFSLVEYNYQYLCILNQASDESVSAVRLFLSKVSEYLKRMSEFSQETHRTGSELTQETELLAKKSMVIHRIFVSEVEKSVSLFDDANVRQKRSYAYTQYYRRLQEIKDKLDASMDQVVFCSISPTSPLRAAPPVRPIPSGYSTETIQALRAMDIQTIPSPQEYGKPFQAVDFRSIVDVCREEFLLKKMHAPQQAVRPKCSDFSDYLPPHLVAASTKKPVQKKEKPRKRDERLLQRPQEKSGKRSDFIEFPPKEVPVASCSQRETQMGDDYKGVSEVAEQKMLVSCNAIGSSVSTSTEPVPPQTMLEQTLHEKASADMSDARVVDGPDLSLRYADHVSRWFKKDRDIFHQDPSYKEKTYSKDLQEEIRFRHSFGLALVPVILRCGKQFMKKDPRTGQVRLSYTLPGEIVRHGRYEKAVFTVSVAKATGHVIHMYATNKTPLTIIQEYACEGWFPADDDEIDRLPRSFERNYRSYALEDDGSRITEETDEFITVTQKDGTILTVYSFPDV